MSQMTDMGDPVMRVLQTQADNFKKERATNIVIAALVFVFLIVLVFNSWTSTVQTDAIRDLRNDLKQLKHSDDSLKAAYIEIGTHLSDLNARIQLQDSLTRVHEKELLTITKKYEKIRNDIRAMPFTDRLRLFSDWLSKIDSNGYWRHGGSYIIGADGQVIDEQDGY